MSKSKKNKAVPPIADTSPHVHQRDKIKFELTIRDLKWTEKQKQFFELALSKENKIFFIEGPAGSSKTLVSMYCALKFLNDKRMSEILLVRSPVESADHSLGLMPGTLEDKYSLYLGPFMDKLEELLPLDQINKLKIDKRLVMAPINFCRGASYSAKCIIADETQNISLKEAQLLLTRISSFTKLFLCYDPEQSDLPKNKQGAMKKLTDAFGDEESRKMGIVHFKFDEEDIVRSELCKFIVKKFKTIEK